MSTSFVTSSSPELPAPEELARQYLLWLKLRNCSPVTLASWEFRLRRFNEWCAQRGIESLSDVTPDVLAAYRRWLYHYRNQRTGQPLKFSTQAAYLTPICRWCAWLAEAG